MFVLKINEEKLQDYVVAAKDASLYTGMLINFIIDRFVSNYFICFHLRFLIFRFKE
jgi:hypothetical protein